MLRVLLPPSGCPESTTCHYSSPKTHFILTILTFQNCVSCFHPLWKSCPFSCLLLGKPVSLSFVTMIMDDVAFLTSRLCPACCFPLLSVVSAFWVLKTCEDWLFSFSWSYLENGIHHVVRVQLCILEYVHISQHVLGVTVLFISRY